MVLLVQDIYGNIHSTMTEKDYEYYTEKRFPLRVQRLINDKWEWVPNQWWIDITKKCDWFYIAKY